MSEDEDKTRIVRPLDQLQRPATPEPSDVDPTRKIDRGENPDTRAIKHIGPEDEAKTVLFRPSPNRPSDSTTFNPFATKAGSQDASNDPVVGWLVVTKAPGRGNAGPLVYGGTPTARA